MNMTTTETGDPAPIKAIPLRRPGRWVAAVVVVVLVGLFIYGSATNEQFGWATYRQYLFDARISKAAWVTIQLTILSMAAAIVSGHRPRGNATVAEPGAEVRCLGVFVGLPRHARLRPARLLGSLPLHIQEHRSRRSVRPSVRAFRHAGSPGGVSLRSHRTRIERGGVHGRNRPCRYRLGQRRSDRSVSGFGNDVGPDDAANGPSPGDAGDHPTDRQRIDQLAQDRLRW